MPTTTLRHKTVHRRTARRFLAAMAAGVVLATGALYATAPAKADALSGCQDEFKLILFQSTRRVICDGELRPDGSWLRAREFYTPAHWVNGRSYCSGGTYYSSCTYSPGYWQERVSQGVETYVVFPDNVLADEPGHLTTGA